MQLLHESGLPYQFLDVELNQVHAEALRALYKNGNLHFPTITIGSKKLRNPQKKELLKWLDRLILSKLP